MQWDGVVPLSAGVEKPQSTPFLILQRRKNLPPWLQLTHRQSRGPSQSLLPGFRCLGDEWVATALSWPLLREDSLRALQLCTPGQTRLHGSFLPACLPRHAGKGVFNFYCSHIDVPTVGASQRPKAVLLNKWMGKWTECDACFFLLSAQEPYRCFLFLLLLGAVVPPCIADTRASR